MPLNMADLNQDEDSRVLYNSLNFLGNPSASTVPGTLAVPESGGPPALPTMPGVSGSAGSQAGPEGVAAGSQAGGASRAGDATGSSDFDTAMKALGLTKEGADFLKQFFGGDLGVRGNIGGEGVPQDSNVSLSDQLRSAATAGVSAGSPGAVQAANQLVSEWLQNPELVGGGVLPDLKALIEGTAGFGGAPSASSLGELGINTSLPSTAGATGAASALGSNLGLAGGGAGVVAALLGLLAQQTGDENLGKAAQALGAVASGATTAGAVTTAIAAPAAAGIGTAAGAAFAPIAAMMIASMISGLAGGEDPVGEGIGEMMEPLMGDYWKFAPKLSETLKTENQSLNSLANALPYAQSQQDVQQLIDMFVKEVGGRVGGYGEGAAPFTIPNLPGAGGSAHEGKQVADFGPQVNALNDALKVLKGFLPETGGGNAAQLWNQSRTQVVPASEGPLQVTMPDGSIQYMTPSDYTAWYNQMAIPMLQAGMYVPEYLGNTVAFGQPGYNYEGAGLVAPGNALGQPSEAWQQMISSRSSQSPAAESTPESTSRSAELSDITAALRSALLGTPGKGPASVPGSVSGAPSLGGSEDLTEMIRRRIAGMA